MTEVVHAKVQCPYLDQLYHKDPKIVYDIVDKYNRWCEDDNVDEWLAIDDEWLGAHKLKRECPELSKSIWCEVYAFVTVELDKHPKTTFYELIEMGIKPFYNEITRYKYNFKLPKEEYPGHVTSTATVATMAWTKYTDKPILLSN